MQFLSRPLPENVNLLSFEPLNGYKGEYILRFEHIYDIEEHSLLSQPIEISVKVSQLIFFFSNNFLKIKCKGAGLVNSILFHYVLILRTKGKSYCLSTSRIWKSNK